MAPHLTHTGVHDHGFNNVSTYGNLLRLMSEGRIPENALGAAILRAGAEMFRRGAGGALVADRRWRRLHLLVQRAAFAVRRHHPLAARAGRQPSAGPRADGRERPQDFAARPRARPSARHRPLLGLLRRRPRRLRRARPRGAREHLQSQRRQLPLSQFAAGLFALHHLDARAGLGHVRIRRSSSNIFAPSDAPAEVLAMLEKAARATCDFYIENTPADGIPYWDTGAPAWAGRLAPPADPQSAEPVDSSAAAIGAQGLLRLGRCARR